jgi:hypothetical protein
MTNEEKMAKLLADVQGVLGSIKGDERATQVLKEIKKLNAEEKMKGLKVVRRYRVKFTAGQWHLLSEANTKEAKQARRKAVVEINAALSKLLNAEAEPEDIKAAMIEVLKHHKSVGAYNKDAEALLNEAIKVYVEQQQ